MRRGRFESVVGLVCVALVLLTGLLALYRGVFLPQVLRWSFLRCEAERSRALLADLYLSSPHMARELMVDLDELEIRLDVDRNVLVSNPCGHRVYVTAFLDEDIAELERLRESPAPAPSPAPLMLRGVSLEAGASARFSEIVRIGCVNGPRAAIRDIPVGPALGAGPNAGVSGASISGCFGYAEGRRHRTAYRR